jgi:galactokinase
MAQIQEIIDLLNAATFPQGLIELYGARKAVLKQQTERYRGLAKRFQAAHPESREVTFFSSPGRTEVGGNHTDHNAGRVLAAAVNLDIVCLVGKTTDGWITIDSEGYRPIRVDTSKLEMIEQEKFTPAALVRGICARMTQLGYQVGGFQGSMTSRVPNGSGLSSSAAFEMMVVAILNHLYNQGNIDPVLAAQIGQFAENQYFGKPCGLMDQTTCAVGGFVTIDFQDFAHPLVHKVNYQFANSGYSLVITGTGGSHADLNEDYAGIENEMKSVARALGGKVLRDVPEKKLLENIAQLRGKVNDRALLRALHFFADDARVVRQAKALESDDFAEFLNLVNESGISSWTLNQNVFSPKNPAEQGVALALAISAEILKGKGAWRVHGGGFAGTIQAFVPDALVQEYIQKMSAIFGEENCHLISIRSQGATPVNLG